MNHNYKIDIKNIHAGDKILCAIGKIEHVLVVEFKDKEVSVDWKLSEYGVYKRIEFNEDGKEVETYTNLINNTISEVVMINTDEPLSDELLELFKGHLL